MSELSLLRRRDLIKALRNGTVPQSGLDLLAVGLDLFTRTIDEELSLVAAGSGGFKAVRGEYGAGKTFFTRWLEHRARQQGFASASVQISEDHTPLHRMETIYRRALESLQTREWSSGAFYSLIDRWLYDLEEEAARETSDLETVTRKVGDLLERRLADVSATHPQFAAALRTIHAARARDEHAVAEGLLAWLMGQPNVGADIKRAAGIKGDLDHRGASGFFRGLLSVLRQTGRKGLVVVLDEVETIQRVRADSRERSLNALRQLIDELDGGVYPGMYVVITGTPQFFDGAQGIKRLPPLEQRLHVTFRDSHDNPRAPQIRLQPFDIDKLVEVGRRVRQLYPTEHPERIAERANDDILRALANTVAGKLGGKIGVAPRIYLRRLVLDVLDKIDLYPDFDPTRHLDIALDAAELTPEERAAAGVPTTVDSISLEI